MVDDGQEVLRTRVVGSPGPGSVPVVPTQMTALLVNPEGPVALATVALAGDPRWSRAEIEQVIATGERRRIDVERPWATHLLYWTAWADADGRISVREDRDGLDERLTLALMGFR